MLGGAVFPEASKLIRAGLGGIPGGLSSSAPPPSLLSESPLPAPWFSGWGEAAPTGRVLGLPLTCHVPAVPRGHDQTYSLEAYDNWFNCLSMLVATRGVPGECCTAAPVGRSLLLTPRCPLRLLPPLPRRG